jgi:predicted amidophosphoribosyltransferase
MDKVIFEDDNWTQNPDDGTLTPKFKDGKITGTRQYFIGKKICSRCWRRVATVKEIYCDNCFEEIVRIEEITEHLEPKEVDWNKQSVLK